MYPYHMGGQWFGFFFGFLFMAGWVVAAVFILIALWRSMRALEAINATLQQIAPSLAGQKPPAGETPRGE
ncbi:MAG: hypothetical protein ACYC7E_17975 [Armatimonadota bacterium]